jgi:hypothetical protein
MKYLLWEWSTMTAFTSLFIVTLLYDLFIERMEYDDILHTFSQCDFIA